MTKKSKFEESKYENLSESDQDSESQIEMMSKSCNIQPTVSLNYAEFRLEDELNKINQKYVRTCE